MTATAVQRLTIPATLRNLRIDREIQLQDAAAAIGVSPAAMSRWERGLVIPYIPQLAAYARTVDRRLTVTRNSIHVADLATVLARLPELRHRQHLSAAALARRLRVDGNQVTATERRARNGERLLFSTIERHLNGLGYQISLAPLTEEAACSR